MNPHIPISVGELIDKITILQIKLEHDIKDAEIEYDALVDIYNSLVLPDSVVHLKDILYVINSKCWITEDTKREAERNGQTFDESFIDAARSVYYFNDLRAATKKQINRFSNSIICEYKSHKEY